MPASSRDYDTIVIGSGAGGLTAAVALARAGQRVLVLEQHYLPGGWCHTFPLGGFHFSTGVHYLGDLGEGGSLRALYEGLGIGGDIVFAELNPDGYDHVQVGDVKVDYCRGKDALAQRFGEVFPSDAKGIRTYLDRIENISLQLTALVESRSAGQAVGNAFQSGSLVRWGARSLDTLLKASVKDPVARAALAAQCGDTGLPPSKLPAAIHAMVARHYFDGGWYPIGGGRSIPRAFLKELRRNGGEIQVRARVERILTETGPGGGRQTVGVRLADGTEISARTVVSNADPGVTYGQLLDPSDVDARTKRKVDNLRWSVSCLSLFLAADIDVDGLGLDSGNYWYLEDADALERAFSLGRDVPLDSVETFPALFITITSLKDRTKRKGRTHTLEVFTFVPWDPFAKWADTPQGERGDDYVAFKDKLQATMLRTADKVIPGLADKVVFQELGTPLSNVHYVASTHGGIYGTEKTLDQMGPFGFVPRTKIDGLWLCGASTLSHGIAGATMSGVQAAQMITGQRLSEMLGRQGPRIRTVPCDDPSAWPDDLKAKLPAD